MARRLDQLEQAIQGGILTDVLKQLGDVLGESGSDHVRQAAYSSDPRARLSQAAGDFPTAYFAYVEASKRGPSRTLRTLFKPTDLRSTYAIAGGCAAWVAVLQAYLGESPRNIREWLDRLAQQLTEDWLTMRSRVRMSNHPVLGEVVPGDDRVSYTEWLDLMSFYNRLESALLPPEYAGDSEQNTRRICPGWGD